VSDGSIARQEHVPTERDALPAAALGAEVERPFLVVRLEDKVTTLELAEGQELLIGRIDGAGVVVVHPSVSRRHAIIRMQTGALSVEDLGTVNGTRVNRIAFSGAVKAIAPGDLVSIGPLEIAVALTTRPAMLEVFGSGRLERELHDRVPAAGLSLVRLVDRPGARAALEDLGDEAPAVDAEAQGEVVALVTGAGRAALERALAANAELGFGAAFASHPTDGATVAELVAHARASADEEQAELGGSVLVADAAMIKVFALARRVAPSTMNVLVTGETGAGKELVAECIHAASPRATQPFVRLNVSAIPEALLESELFGHEKGAFTGATRRKIGYFEAAGEGTLFLDEIGELGASVQAKLLRALETRRYARVGSTEELTLAARVVFATHKDLKAEVGRGAFREDLFYRIGTFTIRVPPLRERPTEISLLAEHFARRLATTSGAPTVSFDKAALTALRNYPWPGNVRELKNAIEHAVVMASNNVVTPGDLPEAIAAGPRSIPRSAVRTELEGVERERIVAALAEEGQNRTYAARRLGMSRRALLYKIVKYGLGRG
jgi:DNA-binding NtrC family response regulator